MPVPPPVTTAEKLDTSNSLEALRSSFDLTEGLSEDIVLITVRVGSLGKVLEEIFLAAIKEDVVRSLSIVIVNLFKIQSVQSQMFDRPIDVGTARHRHDV